MSFPIDALTSRLPSSFSRGFDNMRSQSLTSRFANLKPITEFFDVKRLSKPQNFGEVQSRINYNLSYFGSNYSCLFVMLAVYALLADRFLLFSLGLIIFGLWGIGRLQGADLDVGFFRATSTQLYTGLLCISVPMILFSGIIGTAMWLIGATAVTVLGHAAFMDKPIESAFSEEAV